MKKRLSSLFVILAILVFIGLWIQSLEKKGKPEPEAGDQQAADTSADLFLPYEPVSPKVAKPEADPVVPLPEPSGRTPFPVNIPSFSGTWIPCASS